MTRLLWDPLPDSWPAPERPRRLLRALIASLRGNAAPTPGDFQRRGRRRAMQAIVRMAYQQTLAEQDSEHRGPQAFAQEWRERLVALLAQEMVEVSGWSQIAIAELDTELGWSLFEAANCARLEAIAHAIATPSRHQSWSPSGDSPIAYLTFMLATSVPNAVDGQGEFGVVQYATCAPCAVGLLQKISISPDWQCCGLGTLALRELQARHLGLTWYTTGQLAPGFFARFRQGSASPWTEEHNPCRHR